MNRTQRTLLGIGAGVALAGAVAVPTIAWAQPDSPAPPQVSAGNLPRHPGVDLRADVAALAKELGVSEDKLKAALKNIRGVNKPSKEDRDKNKDLTEAQREEQRKARRDVYAAALAKELGISKDKVVAALDKIEAQHDATRETKLKERLDQAVKDGKLTQAEADAVLKAHKAGVIR